MTGGVRISRESEFTTTPVVHATAASTEAITKELIPIKDQLEQLTKLAKPNTVRASKKHPAEEQPEQLEVNQLAKK